MFYLAFNLGWKIANVVNGVAERSILKTYQSERRRIAQDLIDFDHRFSRLFSGWPAKDVMDEEGISMTEFKDAFEKGNMFANGIAVDYGTSIIVAKEGESMKQGDGTDVMGKKSLRVISQQDLERHRSRDADAALQGAQPGLPARGISRSCSGAGGCWRLVIFAGNIKNQQQKARIDRLGQELGGKKSFLKRFTPANKRYDSVIEVLTVHSAPRQEATIFDFPAVFRAWDERDGWDCWRIYVDDQSYHEGHGQEYQNYGVDPGED